MIPCHVFMTCQCRLCVCTYVYMYIHTVYMYVVFTGASHLRMYMATHAAFLCSAHPRTSYLLSHCCPPHTHTYVVHTAWGECDRVEPRFQTLHHHTTQEPSLPSRDVCQGTASQTLDLQHTSLHVLWQHLCMVGDGAHYVQTFMCIQLCYVCI